MTGIPIFQTQTEMSNQELTDLFRSIGLSEQKVLETIKNDNLSKRLKRILEEAAKFGPVSKSGMLYYHLASKLRPQQERHIPLLVEYIAAEKLNNIQRIDAALQYLVAELKDNIVAKAFEEFCGVGVTVTADEIEQVVKEAVEKYRNDIVEKRYQFSVGLILQEVRNKLKWADGKIVKTEVDLQVRFPFQLHLLLKNFMIDFSRFL